MPIDGVQAVHLESQNSTWQIKMPGTSPKRADSDLYFWFLGDKSRKQRMAGGTPSALPSTGTRPMEQRCLQFGHMAS